MAAAALSHAGTEPQQGSQQGSQKDNPAQAFELQAGDYRWMPVTVRRAPAVIDARYSVVSGSPTVHAELVSSGDFVLFSHGRRYQPLTRTPSAGFGQFQRLMETPGRYRVVVWNDLGAPPAAVSLTVSVDIDPVLSTGASPDRKLYAIVISLSLFAAMVLWSGSRLLRAYRNRDGLSCSRDGL